MNKNEFENKSLIYIICIAYFFNLVFSVAGYVCRDNPHDQVLLFYNRKCFCDFRLRNSGQVYWYTRRTRSSVQLCADGYYTQGLSLAALSKGSMNLRRRMTMAIPMIPALIFIFWCSLFPVWLRMLGILPIALFTCTYVCAHAGHNKYDWALPTGYAALQVIELLLELLHVERLETTT